MNRAIASLVLLGFICTVINNAEKRETIISYLLNYYRLTNVYSTFTVADSIVKLGIVILLPLAS